MAACGGRLALASADDDQHSFDENMRLGNHVDGVMGLIGLLREPF